MKYQIVAPLHYFLTASTKELKFPNRVTLADGYKIQKLNKNLIDQTASSFRRFFSDQDVIDIKECEYAIYYELENNGSGYSGIPENVLHAIDSIVYALRIVRPTKVVRSIIVFDKVNGSVTVPRELNHHRGDDSLIYLFDDNITHQPNNPRYQFFMKGDEYKIRKYFKNIKYLYDSFGGTYHKALNSVFFFELGHMQLFYKVRMITLVTGLESLFNTSSEQVGYTLKERCSFFLSNDPDTRLEIGRKIKKIYRLRSQFVHGQGVDDKALLNDLELQKQLIISAEQYLRECLQKLLSDRALISKFEDSSKLTVLFDELIASKISRL